MTTEQHSNQTRFILSMSEEIKLKLDTLAAEQECSAAALLRRLIQQEYSTTMDIKNNNESGHGDYDKN